MAWKNFCALALMAMVLASQTAAAAMRERPVEWTIGEERFSGVLVYDDANAIKRPGLVMLPNWMGVSSDAIAMAKRVAGDDYVVLIADVYGKDIRPKDDAEALAAVKAAYADGGATLRTRASKAVEALKAQADDVPLIPERVGAFGFCFGGGVALELVRSGAELQGGVVSFHGNLDSYRPADRPVRSAVLALNGADDSSVTAEQIAAFEQEMKAADADWQLVNFGGARHCFSQPEDADKPPGDNCRYNARAAKRAFEMMYDFFREQFGH
jgi:dienelactone hydrolase